MIRIWQEAKFKAMLRNYLSSIISQKLGNIQFNLLLQQAHIRFQSDNDALSYQAWFKRDATISKELEKNIVTNCQEYFIISMRMKNHYRCHNEAKCLGFFKVLMEEKYGNLFEWFGGLNRDQDIRKVHSGAFRENVRALLSNTPHEECSCLIANCFAKNRKNQITIETFKNTMLGFNKRERYHHLRLSLGNISQKGGTQRKEVRCSSLFGDRKSLSLVGLRPSPSPALRTFNRKRISLIK